MNPNFEKYIRKTLSDQEEFVDAESIWEQVEPHVRPEKDRKRFFWWFFFGSIAGIAVAALLWSSLGTRDEFLHEPIVNTEKQSTTPQLSIANNPKLSDVEEGAHNNTITKEESNNLGKVESPALEKKSNKKTSLSQSNNNPTTSNSNTKVTAKNIKQTNKASTSKAIVGEEPIRRSSSNKISETKLKKSTKTKGTEEVIISKSNFSLNSVDAPTLLSEIPGFPMDADDEVIIPVNRQRKWHYALGLYGGIGSVRDDLSATDEFVSSSAINERQQTETQLESISMGMSFTAKHKKNLSFRSGLEYHRIARRLNYEESQITYDTLPNTVLTSYINNTTGDVVYETGTVINSRNNNFEKETFNYLHRLDVPLFLGYTTNGKRFRFGFEVGVYVNALLGRKGKTYLGRESMLFYDLDDDSEKWYKTNVGITPAVQASFNYHVSPRIDIHASPYYRLNTTYTSSESLIKEQYSDFGVQLGVRYWLR